MNLRVLIAYSMASTLTQTTLDYLNAFKDYLGGNVDYLHVTHDSQIRVSLSRYDAVILNYCARLCVEGYVSADFFEQLKNFEGLKILAVQDEYNRTNVLKRAIREIQFHVVLTCVPQDSLEYVYPRSEFPEVRFETVFTGYVPESLSVAKTQLKPLRERPIVVGYRGRDIGGFYGRLGFDKYEIGRRMKEICGQRGIPHDIATDEESRIYGPAWFDFVGSCRAMLGSESGSNVFDFDGSLERQFGDLERELGHRPSYSEFLPVVAQRDSEISMGQISPRVFECALMRTPMVLFRGRYSDAIEPNIHYIMLEKDFSNVDEVLSRLDRFDDLEAMTERTYDHLVASGRFSYQAYMSRISGIIDEEIGSRSTTRANSRAPEMVLDSEIPHWLLQEPTDKPQPTSLFQLIEKKKLFSIYFNEIMRLQELEMGTLVNYRLASDQLLKDLPAGGEGFSAAGEFGRLLDDVELQFRTFAEERSGMSELASRFGDITNLSEMCQLLEVYERQARTLMAIYDTLNSTWNELVTQPRVSGNHVAMAKYAMLRIIWSKLPLSTREFFVPLINRILTKR